uniref:Uncharacterized protein n=1 Tax=Arion vulgaris TaxID=1028688 RepID=A0A0B7AZ47_9EUPU
MSKSMHTDGSSGSLIKHSYYFPAEAQAQQPLVGLVSISHNRRANLEPVNCT